MSSIRINVIRAAGFLGSAALLFGVATLSSGTASAGGGGCHERPAQAEGAGTVVSITYGCFTPTILHVAAGSNVEFQNNDAAVHALSGVGDSQPIADKLAPGSVATRTFPTEGIFPYYCNLHVGMAGVIVVGEASLETAAVAASYTDPGAGSTDDSERAGAAPAPTQVLAAASTTANDVGGLPGVAIAGLGALVGLIVASGVAWPIAWYRGRRV